MFEKPLARRWLFKLRENWKEFHLRGL
jgi:hypothetical protein